LVAGRAVTLNGGTISVAARASAVGGTSQNGFALMDEAKTLTLKSVTAVTGDVNVLATNSANSGSITVAGATLRAPAAVINAVDGNVTIQNENLHGVITVGKSSQILTGNGNIAIFFGTSAPTPSFPSSVPILPTGTTFTQNPNTPPFLLSLGTNGVTFASRSTAPVSLNSVGGGEIILSTGALKASAIRIIGGTTGAPTTITADPPSVSTTMPAVSTLNAASNAVAESSGFNGADKTLTEGVYPQPTGSPAASSSASWTAPANMLVTNALAPSAVSMLTGSATINALTAVLSGAKLGAVPYESVVDGQTDIRTELIRARFLTEKDLGKAVSSDRADVETAMTTNGKQIKLHEGNIVIEASNATEVETAFGRVHIAAGALVLIMATSDAVAVYDLDDTHRDAVTLAVGGNQLSLMPGKTAVIARQAVSSFDLVNPCEGFGYRNLGSKVIGGGLKAFAAEFDMMSAISQVSQLRQLVSASQPEAQRIAGHLAKTSVIVNHMHSGSYQQYPHPCMAAYAP